MSTNPPNRDVPGELDRLLSDFFKAQLKRPWPDAPRPASGFGAARAAAEPSELSAVRTAGAPRNLPAPAARGHDHTARARLTLAASVALMLGTCWYLSDSFEPGTRSLPDTRATGPSAVPGASANGDTHEPLREIRKDKATGEIGPTIDMDEIK